DVYKRQIEILCKGVANVQQGRIDETTTANIGLISGGAGVNIVPERAAITGEVRSFNEEKVEEIAFKIYDTIGVEAFNLGATIDYDSEWDFKPYELDETDLTYLEISEAIKKAGLVPVPKISLGGSDANSYNESGIKSVNIGIGAQKPHSNEEFILIEDLEKSFEIALNLVKK
ncbi:MAG: M20/M25/M40 family metallo-hydrolase, partial [Ignavibacteriaceae bacterium]|nr:M20/M25/M40 family metallo-hydrolase [Ignavibacteriaceae bacterium]